MVEGEVQQKSQRIPRKYLYIIIAAAILCVAAALILMQQKTTGAQLVAYDNVLVPSGILSELNVSSGISNQVGIGTASYQGLVKINGKPALTLNGKPEILYLGAEYCPFCAGERWSMAIALMRFGTLSNLHFMTSSASDYAASSPTFTFYNSSYSSPYISFVSVEQTTNQPNPGGGYVALQTINQSEAALGTAYDPSGGIPFILFANSSAIASASFDPLSVLGGGENWSTIAQALSNPGTLQSSSVVGSANLITAQICKATNNMPASVCDQPYVTQILKLAG